MSAWRAMLILLLASVPPVILAAVGAWTVWMDRRLIWIWWLLPACWAAAWLVSRLGNRPSAPVPPLVLSAPDHWTPRDRQALQVIQQQQEDVQKVSPQQLVDPHHYLSTAMDLSLKIARVYHPKAEDPISWLTVPEVLTAANLALRDLERWTRLYVPGSHLLTVRQWRSLSRAPSWFRTAGDISWVLSMIIRPSNVGRAILSRWTMDSARKQIQANLLAWFYMTFVRHVGFYLIEMNSGRLRGGTDEYLGFKRRTEERAEAEKSGLPDDGASSPDRPVEITLAIVGQVKAGKSSLVNALLGEHQAAVDILPNTQAVERYRVQGADADQHMILLDTPGYADAEARRQQQAEIEVTCRQADCILLVMDATSPARAADQQLVEALHEWFQRQWHRRPPPMLGVLTHIDLLRPVLLWEPPYDWQTPKNAKERQIRQAVEYNARLFGSQLAGVVPLCTGPAPQRAYGVKEWLVPAIAALLDESRACALLRNMHDELERRRVTTLAWQFRNLGWEILRASLSSPSR